MLPQSSQANPSTLGVHPPRDPRLVRRARRKSALSIFLRTVAWIAFLTGVGVFLSLPLELPSGVNTFGTITSAHEWVLAKGTGGQLVASTFNYTTGSNEGYQVSNFDPGSSVYLSLRPSLAPGRFIAKGDTVGNIYSSEMQERLIALNGQLAAARSLLAVNASGQKAVIVADAEQRLFFAIRKRDEHRTILTRTQKLLQAGLIPQGEYDRVLSDAHVLQDDIKIAEAQLETARTGAKPEQLDLVHTNIGAIQNEIDAIKRRAAGYTLTAPISGTVSRAFSGDTLLTICDTTKYVALIAIKWSDYTRVAATKDARVRLRGFSKNVTGTVVSLNRQAQVLQGQNVIIATALLEGSSEELMPGMVARCRIACRPVTPLEYVKRLWTSLTT